MTNENCLVGWECPKCHSEGPFWIDAIITGQILMSDEGTVEENIFHTGWEPNSIVHCPVCDFQGNVKTFAISNFNHANK